MFFFFISIAPGALCGGVPSFASLYMPSICLDGNAVYNNVHMRAVGVSLNAFSFVLQLNGERKGSSQPLVEFNLLLRSDPHGGSERRASSLFAVELAYLWQRMEEAAKRTSRIYPTRMRQFVHFTASCVFRKFVRRCNIFDIDSSKTSRVVLIFQLFAIVTFRRKKHPSLQN